MSKVPCHRHGPILPGGPQVAEAGDVGTREYVETEIFDALRQDEGVQVFESLEDTGAPSRQEILRCFADAFLDMNGWSQTQRWTLEGASDGRDLRDLGLDPALFELVFWMEHARALNAQLVSSTPLSVQRIIPRPPAPGALPETVVRSVARFILTHLAATPQPIPALGQDMPGPPSLPEGTHEVIGSHRQEYREAMGHADGHSCAQFRSQVQELFQVRTAAQVMTGHHPVRHLWWLDPDAEAALLTRTDDSPLGEFFQRLKRPSSYTLATTECPPQLTSSSDSEELHHIRGPPSAAGGIEAVQANILNWRLLAMPA